MVRRNEETTDVQGDSKYLYRQAREYCVCDRWWFVVTTLSFMKLCNAGDRTPGDYWTGNGQKWSQSVLFWYVKPKYLHVGLKNPQDVLYSDRYWKWTHSQQKFRASVLGRAEVKLAVICLTFKFYLLQHVPPTLKFKNSSFCPHSVFMCFVWISEQTAIISLYNVNWLVFITETECVYCAVRTGCLNATFCPHSVFMYFVWISEQTAIISLYSVNWLVFVTDFCKVTVAICTWRERVYVTSGVPAFGVNFLSDDGGIYATETCRS
jgi:hypothetical protein